jgi:hypothetical protein
MNFIQISSFRYLQQNERLLSVKTAALFRSLINMLVIDICFAAVTGKFNMIFWDTGWLDAGSVF